MRACVRCVQSLPRLDLSCYNGRQMCLVIASFRFLSAESQNSVSRLFFIVEKVYIHWNCYSTYKIEFDTKIHMIVLYADIISVLCNVVYRLGQRIWWLLSRRFAWLQEPERESWPQSLFTLFDIMSLQSTKQHNLT